MQRANQRAATVLHKSYVNKYIGFDEYHRRLLELEKNDMTDSRITHEGQHKPVPPAEFTVAADLVTRTEHRVVVFGSLIDEKINDINELKGLIEVAGAELESLVSQRDVVKAELDNLNGEVEIMHCSECGSGDVSYCSISVRPHCNECRNWGAVNWTGTKADSIAAWNKASKDAGR